MRFFEKIKHIIRVTIIFLTLSSPGANACIGIDISASELNFGSYDALSSFSLRSTFNIQIDCLFDITMPLTFPLAYRIGIDSALLAGDGTRRIKHQSLDFYLNYGIYSDSSLSQILGSITGNDVIEGAFQSIDLATTQQFTGYGIIPGSQNVPAGIYSDQLTITVEF